MHLKDNLNATGLKFAIVVARFNSFITDRLLAGASTRSTRSGCNAEAISKSSRCRAPGSCR